ncbi:SPOR domain-containing protein [Stutzerimonas urumqiensis]|uniref:SPOR domain-containing protein n=1 Tax=Stutzerimonas urumqiensis TaxID=638269 RepID=UPI003BAC6DD6
MEGWSIQLASLSTAEAAESLRGRLRSSGYNAYVRSSSGLNRVFVGPVASQDEAYRLRDELKKVQQLEGFVVRYQRLED